MQRTYEKLTTVEKNKAVPIDATPMMDLLLQRCAQNGSFLMPAIPEPTPSEGNNC